jgi:DNA-binding NarL/FixJ family response regulator
MNDAPHDVADIRVLVADDHMVVRAGLKSLLGAEPDIRVIAEVSNGPDAVSYAIRLEPDVVIMDLTMPGQDGIEATKEIIEKAPKVRVLVLTVHPEDESLVAAMNAGASGYLLKTDADREIAAAVRAVSRGERYLRPRAEQLLQGSVVDGDAGAPETGYRRLTQRERAVLRLRSARSHRGGDRGASAHQPQVGGHLQAENRGQAEPHAPMGVRAVCVQVGDSSRRPGSVATIVKGRDRRASNSHHAPRPASVSTITGHLAS